MDTHFTYQGPADIDGVEFRNVHLREERDGGLRSWGGLVSFPASQEPAGFSPNLGADPVTVLLPDGRSGQALASIDFNGQDWSVQLLGTGPAPGM